MKTHVKKNIIVFINTKILGFYIESIRQAQKQYGKDFEILFLSYKKLTRLEKEKAKAKGVDIILDADFSDKSDLQNKMKPYLKNVFSVFYTGELSVHYAQQFFRVFPDLHHPPLTALNILSDKKKMKQRMYGYDSSITSPFVVVPDKHSINLSALRKLKYPVVVKPTKLYGSLLVQKCMTFQELPDLLERTFLEYKNLKIKHTDDNCELLVEEFVPGSMYSIDVYVDRDGFCYFCPLVSVQTGQSVLGQSFHNFIRVTPVDDVSSSEMKSMEHVVKKAIVATKLKSSTAHVELIRSKQGWNIIEIGARMGGFRPIMCQLGFGINHVYNEILVHAGQRPVLKVLKKNYVAVCKLYPKQNGSFVRLEGICLLKSLSSFYKIVLSVQYGDVVRLAECGGAGAGYIVLKHKNKKKLKEDIDLIKKKVLVKVQ